MAAWLDNLARRFGGSKPTAAPQRRDFSAAIVSRLTASWKTSNLSANADIYRSLDALRARSRDLAQNNVYARKFIQMVGANVVGPAGFTLQARVYDKPDEPDNGANDAIETAFKKWGTRGVCEVSGQYSFTDLCTLLVAAAARDGEFMVRVLRGKDAGNGFGFALQVLDIDRLDTTYNAVPETGHHIRMGVEINQWGRPIAYHLKTSHPGDMWLAGQTTQSTRRLRIPAEDIIHRFVADRPEQLRGVPWMHAAMIQLNNLGGYEEAAIIAARVGASKMGFFTSPDGDPMPLADGQDENGVAYTDADPGTFGTLPPGYDFKSFDPDYPHAMFGDFIKAALRGAASGMGVAYNELANDLEGVSYSSIRQGVLSERDQWMQRQAWFISAFLDPVYNEWLRGALAFGRISLANGSPLPIAKYDKFSNHEWQGRRWQWVDPLKDVETARLSIQTGIASPQMIAAQNGVDVEDVIVAIKRFETLVEKAGVKAVDIAKAPPATPMAAPAAQNPEEKPAKPAAEPAPQSAKLLALEAENRQLQAENNTLRIERAAPSIVINNAPPAVTFNAGETRNEINLPEQPAPVVNITNEIEAPELPETIINVAAPNVEVTVEANMPAQSEVSIVAMPDRKTTSEIVRDGSGNIKQSTQTETDA